jgi:hypothetical protein
MLTQEVVKPRQRSAAIPTTQRDDGEDLDEEFVFGRTRAWQHPAFSRQQLGGALEAASEGGEPGSWSRSRVACQPRTAGCSA